LTRINRLLWLTKPLARQTSLTGRDLRAALDSLLADHAIAEDQRPSIGCNIKWKQGLEPDYFNAAGIS
jgi:hypothetical protein